MGESTKLTTSEILARVAKLPPEERKRAERALLIQYQPSAIVNRTPEAEELEAQGWEVWLQELAPHVFRGTHADFHRAFWNWYWPLLMAKRDGKRLTSLTEVVDGRVAQMALAYLLTLGRGMGKSTSVEWACIALGAILGQVCALYTSSVAKLAKGHLSNIRGEIEDSSISKYYPGLSNPEVGKHNNRYGWNQELLSTMSGLTIFAVGLEEEIRGIKKGHLRPGMIVLDEFDSKTDSPDVVKKKESIIGGSLFGTQVEDTIILMAQNLIHGQSVATRTHKRRNELLSHRRESGLIRAFTEDFEIEMVGTRWKVTKGQPTWPYLDLHAVQKWLDTSGPVETYCHPAGTLVTTDVGVLPIENVDSTHAVVAHTGLLKRVTGSTRRVFSGDLTLIRRAGRSGFVRSTPEHRFYVARRKVSRAVFYQHRCDPALLGREWIAAHEIQIGDYLLEPVPRCPDRVLDGEVIWKHVRRKFGSPTIGPQEIIATKALCRLIGYYLAEGNGSGGSVRFDFHERETRYHDEVLAFGKEVFHCTGGVRRSHGRGVTVVLHSTIAKRFFDTFGKGAHHKFIPAWVFQLSPDLCREIIIGYMRGDGNKSTAGFAFATASLQLGEGIRRLMLYCDIAANLYKLPPRTLRLPQGSMFTRGDFWMGTVNGAEGVKLGAVLGIPHVQHHRHSGHSFTYNGYLHARVADVNALPACSLTVYNLHVEDDHSYLADGAASHNCEYQHDFSRDKEGKIFKNYRDKDAEGFKHVITEEEFANVYGVRRPPTSWNKWMFNDKSRTKSEFHANVAGTLTMSSQNTPLPGITFLYDCLTFEADAQPDDCAIEMLKCITPRVRVDGIDFEWEDLLRVIIAREGIERFTGSLYEQIQAQRAGLAKIIPKYVAPLLASQHYQKFRMSHEADDWRKVYREVFGLPFVAANPAEGQGLELMDLTMKVDETVRDPFRPWQMGMSRFYIIVKPGKVTYPNDNKPDLLFGSDLARYQFTEQRYLASKVTATGEVERGPEKRNDDFANGCLVAGTLIRTSQGERPIQDIKPGELMWTRAGWRKVLVSEMTNPAAEVFTLETSVGELRGTGDHPVWVEGKGFIPLLDLSVGEQLEGDESPLVVKKAERSGFAPVYNLQVEDTPEYFANGILVHNCQFFYMDHSIQARELTREEMFEAQLAPPLQQAAIDAETDPEKKRQQHYAREVAIRRQLMAKITENLGGGRTRGSAGSRLADYRSLERHGK